MLVASGLEYVFASAIIFALGIPLFAGARNKMSKKEKVVSNNYRLSSCDCADADYYWKD